MWDVLFEIGGPNEDNFWRMLSYNDCCYDWDYDFGAFQYFEHVRHFKSLANGVISKGFS